MIETVGLIAAWTFTAGVVVWGVHMLISDARENRKDDEKWRYRMQLIQLMFNMTAEEVQEKWEEYQKKLRDLGMF